MARRFPAIRFERYCDDVIVHAASERQARLLRAAIAGRLAECGLALNEHKTRIVYCKDATRRGAAHTSTSASRSSGTRSVRGCRAGSEASSSNFLPAIGDQERKHIGRIIRRWRLHRWSRSTLIDLAKAIDAEVRGWIN